MGAIIPAILPTSRKDLEDKLTQLQGLVSVVQIDIVDGIFASPASWPYDIGGRDFALLAKGREMLPHHEQFRFDMDLMIQKPEEVIGMWIAAGASRITIHAESSGNLQELISTLGAKYGHEKEFAAGLLQFGLALDIDSDFALIEPYLECIDYVQFMGIKKPGHQHEPFDKRVLEKVASLHKWAPDMRIQVDGGVNLENAPLLLDRGVCRLVVGSALWRASDLPLTLHNFTALTERHGIYE